jgi:hypothetical protein
LSPILSRRFPPTKLFFSSLSSIELLPFFISFATSVFFFSSLPPFLYFFPLFIFYFLSSSGLGFFPFYLPFYFARASDSSTIRSFFCFVFVTSLPRRHDPSTARTPVHDPPRPRSPVYPRPYRHSSLLQRTRQCGLHPAPPHPVPDAHRPLTYLRLFLTTTVSC